jgi:hypothetical protein
MIKIFSYLNSEINSIINYFNSLITIIAILNYFPNFQITKNYYLLHYFEYYSEIDLTYFKIILNYLKAIYLNLNSMIQILKFIWKTMVMILPFIGLWEKLFNNLINLINSKEIINLIIVISSLNFMKIMVVWTMMLNFKKIALLINLIN